MNKKQEALHLVIILLAIALGGLIGYAHSLHESYLGEVMTVNGYHKAYEKCVQNFDDLSKIAEQAL